MPNKATTAAIRRIAELKIEVYKLPETVEEYIEKCSLKNTK